MRVVDSDWYFFQHATVSDVQFVQAMNSVSFNLAVVADSGAYQSTE